MRFVYSYLVLAVAVGCGDESSHHQPDTSEETASEAPASTTDSAEPTSSTSPTTTTTTGGVEPNSVETSTTGEAEAEDTGDTAGSSTTEASSDTDDTSSTTEPASETEGPVEETTGGSDPQPCVGATGPVKAEVIAYLESQIGEGDTDGEPGRLYLRFSSQSFTCADPHDALACGYNWEVSLQIPAEFLVPGVHALADGPIDASASSTSDGDVCEVGEGAVSGTLEIDAVEEGSVIGRLCHLRASLPEGQILLDGTFEAPRCSQ